MTTTVLKPGVKTTEFWLTLVGQVAGVLTLLTGLDVGVEADAAVKGVGAATIAVSGLGYAISRGLAKKGAAPAAASPDVAPV